MNALRKVMNAIKIVVTQLVATVALAILATNFLPTKRPALVRALIIMRDWHQSPHSLIVHP